MCKQSINIKLYSFLLAAFLSPSRPGLVKMCHILWCLEGVWEVSVGCLSDSRYCLGGMMCKQLINTQWKILYLWFLVS